MEEKQEYNVNELWLEIGKECGGTALTTYLVILNERNCQTNACSPSMEDIAEKTAITTKTVQRNLNKLYESGYLLINSGSVGKNSNYYFPKERFFEDFENDPNQKNAKRRTKKGRYKNEGKPVAGIYLITNTETGTQYVGQAVNIRTRWIQHIQELRARKHCNQALQEDFDKYGEDAFDFKVLEVVEDSPVLDIELDRKENKWGKKYHVLEEGYNKAHFIDPFKQKS